MFTLTANRKRKTLKGNRLHGFRLACALALAVPGIALAAPNLNGVRISGHIPAHALATAKHLGRVAPTERIPLSLALPLRNQAALDDLLKHLYDPKDPMHGKYLTTQQFQDQFSPTQADYDKVITYAHAQGFLVKGLHANRTLLDVEAPASVVESTFHLQMHRYQAQNGRQFYAPDAEPMLPAEIAPHLAGVIGLDNAAVPEPYLRSSIQAGGGSGPIHARSGTGSGPNGGLAPSDIKTAYGLNNTALNGAGETLALFELDGYTASDISAYEQKFGLPAVPLQNVLIDGFTGNPVSANGASEVTLDIELMTALAPHASKILVYEGPHNSPSVYKLTLVHIFDRIASDDLAREISCSWGAPEQDIDSSTLNSENVAFLQMAAQGQSIFVASGDSGADANGSSLSVQDPASQPYVVSVGGTKLTVNSNHTYQSETTWNDGGGASGAASAPSGAGPTTRRAWALPAQCAMFPMSL